MDPISFFISLRVYTVLFVCCACYFIRLLAANKTLKYELLSYECNYCNCNAVEGFMERVPSACRRMIQSYIFRAVFPESKSSNSYKTSVLPHVLQTC